MRSQAVAALNAIGDAAVPALTIALTNDPRNACVSAVDVLGRIGPAAKEAVPALILTLNDSDVGVRSYTAHTLSKIGPARQPFTTETQKKQ